MTSTSMRTTPTIKCLLALDQTPGHQLVQIRNPARGLYGWVSRFERRLLRKILPEFQLTDHVRGNRVARDYLLEALLRYSTLVRFCFAVHDSDIEQFRAWSCQWSNKHESSPIELHSARCLVTRELNDICPDIWLDLSTNGYIGPRIRDAFSDRVYPTVSIQHGMSMHSLLYGNYLRLLLTPSYSCDTLVCTTQASRKSLTALLETTSASFRRQFGVSIDFNGQVAVIPLCVDTDLYRPRDKGAARANHGIDQNEFILLYIGYLSPVKADLLPLLAVVRHLSDTRQHHRLRLIIAGTGPTSYYNSLRLAVNELHLSTKITILRGISDQDKQSLLNAADVFVAPCDSIQESFGLTPIEAMASGLPQVVANWNGYRDTVVHGATGFLVPSYWGKCDGELRGSDDILGWEYDHAIVGQSVSFDIAEMIKAIDALMVSHDLRGNMAHQSRLRAINEYSYACIAKRYDELFMESILSGASLTATPKDRRFDHAAYFDTFGHYATKHLTEGSIVRLSNIKTLSMSRLLAIIKEEIGIGVFDEKIFELIIHRLSGGEEKRVDQVISEMAMEAVPEVTKRHLLWLLKHGKIEVI